MSGGFSTTSKGRSSGVNPLVVALLGLALLCFGVAFFYFFSMTSPPPPQAAAPTVSEFDLVDVLVPVDRIEPGTALEPILFRKESRPALAVSSSRIKDFEQLKGTFAASFIAAGQPLLAEYVTLRKPVNQTQASISEGYRAVTMAVDETTSVEGWARAGAKVDVLMISPVNGRNTATIVVQNAKVLAGGGSDEDDPKNKERIAGTVTLMVTLEDAAKIQLASSTGSLSLVLRGDEDTIVSPENSTVAIDSIFTGEQGPQVADIPSEGKVKIDGREFLIFNGKLVPQGQ